MLRLNVIFLILPLVCVKAVDDFVQRNGRLLQPIQGVSRSLPRPILVGPVSAPEKEETRVLEAATPGEESVTYQSNVPRQAHQNFLPYLRQGSTRSGLTTPLLPADSLQVNQRVTTGTEVPKSITPPPPRPVLVSVPLTRPNPIQLVSTPTPSTVLTQTETNEQELNEYRESELVDATALDPIGILITKNPKPSMSRDQNIQFIKEQSKPVVGTPDSIRKPLLPSVQNDDLSSQNVAITEKQQPAKVLSSAIYPSLNGPHPLITEQVSVKPTQIAMKDPQVLLENKPLRLVANKDDETEIATAEVIPELQVGPELQDAAASKSTTTPSTHVGHYLPGSDGSIVFRPEPAPLTTVASTQRPATLKPVPLITVETSVAPVSVQPVPIQPVHQPKPIQPVPQPKPKPVIVASVQKPTKLPSNFGKTPLLPTGSRPITNVIPTQQIDYECKYADGYIPIQKDCDSYIECRKRIAYKFECPDGLHFNRDAVWPEYPCVYPGEAKCEVNAVERVPQPTSECPRQYGYFTMKGDCSNYIMCQEGIATIMSCPVGLVFNPNKYICDWPENVPSCSSSVFVGFTCPSIQIEDEELITKFRYGDSCKEYVACQRGQPRLLSCDSGLAFDEQLQFCVDADYVKNCRY